MICRKGQVLRPGKAWQNIPKNPRCTGLYLDESVKIDKFITIEAARFLTEQQGKEKPADPSSHI